MCLVYGPQTQSLCSPDHFSIASYVSVVASEGEIVGGGGGGGGGGGAKGDAPGRVPEGCPAKGHGGAL